MNSLIEIGNRAENSIYEKFVSYVNNVIKILDDNKILDAIKDIDGNQYTEVTDNELLIRNLNWFERDLNFKLHISNNSILEQQTFDLYNEIIHYIFDSYKDIYTSFRLYITSRINFIRAINDFLVISIQTLQVTDVSVNLYNRVKNISFNFPKIYSLLLRKRTSYLNFIAINFPLIFRFQDVDAMFSTSALEDAISTFTADVEKISVFKGKFAVFNNDFKRTFYSYEGIFNFEILEEDYAFDLYYYASTESDNAEILISTFYYLLSGFSQLEGVTTKIDSIKVGSLYTKISVFMSNLFAKKQTVDFLNTTLEIAGKAASGGTVSHATIKKTSAEEGKIIAETTKLTKESELITNPEVKKRSDELDLREKEEKIKKLQLENEKLFLENAAKKFDVLRQISELIKQGLVRADYAEVYINDNLLITRDSNGLHPKEPINEIE